MQILTTIMPEKNYVVNEFPSRAAHYGPYDGAPEGSSHNSNSYALEHLTSKRNTWCFISMKEMIFTIAHLFSIAHNFINTCVGEQSMEQFINYDIVHQTI